MQCWVTMPTKRTSPAGTAESISHSHVCCLVHMVFGTAERRAGEPIQAWGGSPVLACWTGAACGLFSPYRALQGCEREKSRLAGTAENSPACNAGLRCQQNGQVPQGRLNPSRTVTYVVSCIWSLAPLSGVPGSPFKPGVEARCWLAGLERPAVCFPHTGPCRVAKGKSPGLPGRLKIAQHAMLGYDANKTDKSRRDG